MIHVTEDRRIANAFPEARIEGDGAMASAAKSIKHVLCCSDPPSDRIVINGEVVAYRPRVDYCFRWSTKREDIALRLEKAGVPVELV